MKEIVVISGKGGTGKTSITASFIYLARKISVIADCDVDAADLHLIFKPKILRKEDFYSSLEAVINQDECVSCNRCMEVCRFDAVKVTDLGYEIIPLNCEGCAYCEKVCPTDAITMRKRLDGEWYISETRLHTPMAHAKLGIGTENSGKLVATVKNIAKQLAEMYHKEFVIVDGSPGVGCPVISSLSGASYVVFVAEPTVSGVHDLKRVYELAEKFSIPSGLIINKSDLNSSKTEELKRFAEDNRINFLAELPYDENFTKAMIEEKTIIEAFPQSQSANAVRTAWQGVLDFFNNQEF